MSDGAAKAALILRGLGGHHLSGLLPGQDHKSAVSAIASGMGGWVGGGDQGGVTHRGIETYTNIADACTRTNPTVRVTWAEVTEIVAKGCEGGRREAYVAACKEWRAFTQWRFDVAPGKPTKVDHERHSRVTAALRATTAEIVRHGCSVEPPQMALF